MSNIDLKKYGITNCGNIYRNLSPALLTEIALAKNEGHLSNSGALVVNTGKYNGRSPDDRFIVDSPSVHEHINWGKVNKPITEEVFDSLLNKMRAYVQKKDLYIFDGFVGADKDYRHSLRVIHELASQSMASSSLFLRPSPEELDNFSEDLTVICLPLFKTIPELDNTNSECFVVVNFDRTVIIIGGTQYFVERVIVIITVSFFSNCNIFQKRTEFQCIKYLWFILSFQIDCFCITAALKIENSVFTPSVLIISYKFSIYIRRKSCLAGSGKPEENCSISMIILIGRAVHWKYIFKRKKIIHCREDCFFDLTEILCSAYNNYFPVKIYNYKAFTVCIIKFRDSFK